MTRGIYRIFLGQEKIYYIGQSLNIQERIAQHKSLLKNTKHYNWKMQKAYSDTNIFSYEILEECDSHNTMHLREKYYIELYDSIYTGYNIASAGVSGAGIEHPSNIYSKEQIIDVMYLCLEPTNTYANISSLTGVSISTIRHIADRSVHYWLEDTFPEECIKLVYIRDNRLRNSSLRTTKVYKFNRLISPEGVIYSVDNISAFGRKHLLDSNKLGEILRGTRNTHKGWRGTNDTN